jgi:1-acyl-sn-glycerol-3-phosphate acyltransferase
MLETFLAWAYLWPVSAGVLFVSLVALLTINLVVSAAILVFYYLLPQNLVDDIANWIVHSFREKFDHYFDRVESHLQSTFVMEGQEKIPETSLLLWHPHSLMSITPTLHCSFRIHDLHSKLVSHGIYHAIPFIRDMARISHIIPADFEAMKKSLQDGHSVSVIPGGVREMMTTKEEKTIQLFLKKRKGIFRLALITGRPLVPLMTYGEGDLFPPVQSTFMSVVNDLAYSMFKIAVPITSLTAIHNWIELYYHPLSPVKTYVGEPIEVKQTDSPTEEDIAALREEYMNAVRALFESSHPEGYTLSID